uniref:Natural resistance-associated macrophage protein n=1 Tax=Chlamydomonas euryale TaxID=1486919 RepID=A0A7R9V4I2_9CHLO
MDGSKGNEGAEAVGVPELDDPGSKFSTLQFLRFCGSGLLMSVSYLDPGNLEADIQVGVATGYDLLWWYATCAVLLGFVVQCLAGQLGLVTGQDLAQVCGQRYPRFARWLLWLLLELAIVGADIQETIGSAIAIFILSGGAIPLWAGCILISVTAFLLLLLDRFGFRHIEAVFGIFIAVEAVALGMNFFQAGVDADALVRGLVVPTLTRSSLPVAVGALGALVMPYNIYFQSSIVNARPRDTSTEGRMGMLLTYMRLENMIMLVMAFVINVFVVCVFAEGFYDPAADPQPDIGLESAGDHLADHYGSIFRTMWAVGLLASGQVATISLTYAGQLVMTGLLGVKVSAGPRMLATRMVALVPTVLMAVFFEASNTFDAAAQLLNVGQSLLLPFALLPVVHMTANVDVMGRRWVSGRWWTGVSIGITVATVAVNGYLLVDSLVAQHDGGLTWPWMMLTISTTLLYYAIVAYYAIGPDNIPEAMQRTRKLCAQATNWVARCLSQRLDPESALESRW